MNDANDPVREPRPARAGGRRKLAIAALLVAIVGGGVAWSLGRNGRILPVVLTGTGASADPYVGARSCRECHPGEYAFYTGSGHARTLRPAEARGVARLLEGQSVPDPEFLGAVWSYVRRDGKLVAERDNAERHTSIPLDYAIGSGSHAVTFLSLIGHDRIGRPLGMEHRFTYFAPRKALAVSPGQLPALSAAGGALEGRHLRADETLTCLACHSTRLGRNGPKQLDRASWIPNVSCERCHGPGRAHIEAARRGASALSMPFGHGAESATDELRLCGECHRLPENVPPSDLRPDRRVLPRFQPVGLMQSKCFTQTPGGLACTECHEPHARTSRDRSAYVLACLSCHAAKPQAVCSVSPREGCLDCHMPRRDTGDGLFYADHWIRIDRASTSGR